MLVIIWALSTIFILWLLCSFLFALEYIVMHLHYKIDEPREVPGEGANDITYRNVVVDLATTPDLVTSSPSLESLPISTPWFPP